MNASTTSREFFDRKYRADDDPWSFASSAYELGRYDATMRAVEHRRYQRAFEPGCAIGVLTARLAAICDRVDAMDISPAAVEQARERCRNLPNVKTTCGALPGFLPAGNFDLVVFSEVGYYFEEDALRRLAEELVDRICTCGVLLAAHWLGSSKDHLLQGDRVHKILGSIDGLALELSERHHNFGSDEAGFRLDRWVRR
jgi:SAM-dependent methyltransferase